MIDIYDAFFHPHASGCAVGPHMVAENNRVWCGHCGEVIWPDACAVDITIRNLHLICEAGVGIWQLPDLGADLHRCGRRIKDEAIEELLNLELGRV